MQKIIWLTVALAATSFGQRKTGDPLAHLPRNIEVLTHFGERADISPDNKQVAFMNKSFGDAFTIDLATKVIRCVTCSVPAAAFLRIMHLPNGDYVLIGPEHFTDIRTSRTRDNELWWLSRQGGSKPVRLDLKLSEGVAISKKNMRISYSVTAAQNPDLQPGVSQLFVADLEAGNAGEPPHVKTPQMVYESGSKACTIEAQDFYDDDRKMTFTCYEPQGLASVMTIDLQTRKVENMSKAPGTYNECEGIYPGGQYTNVEADRQVNTLGGKHGSGNIDIWKLKLDGTGKDFVRLTDFNDYEGFKASNPVVSIDGKFMAFQLAHPADAAGVGYGLLIYRFKK